MAQFEVPQFIDIESKIVGPLTLKQFIFVAIPLLISFFLFFILNMFVWAIVAITLISFGISLAFLKISGRPFYKVVLFMFKYFWEPKLYLWRSPIVSEMVEISDIKRKRNYLEIVNTGISSVSKLWQEIMTRKTPIPRREKKMPKRTTAELQEQYQVFKRITGDKKIAKRVDYR